MSFAAISTTEISNIQIPVLLNARTFCSMVDIPIFATSVTGIVSVPMQTSIINQNTIFSTDTVNEDSYDNGNISLWLEGDSVMSVEKARNLARLLEIEQLQDNWNGNGANCFSESILSFARKIVMNLLIQPAVFPTARDGIQLEYENELGDYLELELFENERIKMFSFDHTGKSLTEEINYDSINKVVSKFYGRNI